MNKKSLKIRIEMLFFCLSTRVFLIKKSIWILKFLFGLVSPFEIFKSLNTISWITYREKINLKPYTDWLYVHTLKDKTDERARERIDNIFFKKRIRVKRACFEIRVTRSLFFPNTRKTWKAIAAWKACRTKRWLRIGT